MAKRICRITLPLAILVGALLVYRLAVGSSTLPPQVAAQRDEPLVIAPKHHEPLVASDEELLAILKRVVPAAEPVNTNNFVHALRLWGPQAKFENPALPSSELLREYFLDDHVFRRMAGPAMRPIFARTPDGLLRARFYDDGPIQRTTSSYHTDDLLATLAESGTPLSDPLIMRDETATVRELAASAMLDFHLARHEFEWSIISYARYVFPQKRWQNKFGETITVDQLVDLLVDSPCGVGPCNGLHRLEALVVLYRADEQSPVLSSSTRRKMTQHMQRVSQMLVASQTDAGYWTRQWPRGEQGRNDQGASVYDHLLVTGHQLEWLALAPEEVLPPRENIVRAARWTVKTILEISDEELQQHYGPFSHAARAIALWRGTEPGDFWQAHAE